MGRQNPSVITSAGFSIMEVLVVMTIILILAGLILATSQYVQTAAKRARAKAETVALATGLENYKTDNGVYPIDTADGTTNALDARTMFNPAAIQYPAASLFLYKQLSGDPVGNRIPTEKSYFIFPPGMLLPKTQTQAVTAIIDPFGHSYGYSTAGQTDPTRGYNPTFDLWSTAGSGTGAGPSPGPVPQEQWIKNW
jgi:prepilin-type N-terminal cleavage/methylation domain-containing protein